MLTTIPGCILKANGPIGGFHKNPLIDPQDIIEAIFIAIIIIRILENPLNVF